MNINNLSNNINNNINSNTINKLSLSLKNDKKFINKTNINSSNNYISNSKNTKGDSFKTIDHKIKMQSINNINNLINEKKNLKLEELMNKKSYVKNEKKNFYKKDSDLNEANSEKLNDNYIFENNNINNDDFKNFEEEDLKKKILSEMIPAININNIHIKNLNFNANSNISDLLDLTKLKNLNNYINKDSLNFFETENNKIYLNTDINCNFANKDNEYNKQKQIIQVSKFNGNQYENTNANIQEKLTIKEDFINKANIIESDKLKKEENNLFINNDSIPFMKETFNKFNKINVNRGHVKTHSAYEFNSNYLNLKSNSNQIINPNHDLKKEIKIFDCMKKSDKNINNDDLDLIKYKAVDNFNNQENLYVNLYENLYENSNQNSNYFNRSNIPKFKKNTNHVYKNSMNSLNFKRFADFNIKENNDYEPPLTTKNIMYNSNNIFNNKTLNNFSISKKAHNLEFKINENKNYSNKIKDDIPNTIKDDINLDKDKNFSKPFEKNENKNLLIEIKIGDMIKNQSNSLSNIQDFMKGNKNDIATIKYISKNKKIFFKNYKHMKGGNTNNYNTNDKKLIHKYIDRRIEKNDNLNKANNFVVADIYNFKNKINNKSLSFGDLTMVFDNKKILSNQLKVHNFDMMSPKSNNGLKELDDYPTKLLEIQDTNIKSVTSLGSQAPLGNDSKNRSEYNFHTDNKNNIINSVMKDFKNKKTELKKDLYDLVKNRYKNILNKNILNNNLTNKNQIMLDKDCEVDELHRKVKTTRNKISKRFNFNEENLENIFIGQENKITGLNCDDKVKIGNESETNLIASKNFDIEKNEFNLLETKNSYNNSSNIFKKENSNKDNLNINFHVNVNNFLSIKKSDLKINTNYNTNNNELSIFHNNYFNLKIFNNLTNRNEKIKILDLFDKEKDTLKIHFGPLDINFITYQDPKEIINQYINIIKIKKISHVQVNTYKLRCTKNGLSFNIEIFRLEDDVNLLYVKIKMLQGQKEYFRKILKNFMLTHY